MAPLRGIPSTATVSIGIPVRYVAPAKGAERSAWLCPSLLSLAFVLSFLQYFWPIESKTIQLVPISVLLASGYVGFVDCCRKGRLGTSLVALGPILGAAALTTIVSGFAANQEALLYGTLMLLVLPAVRFILGTIRFKGLLESYHRASMVSLALAVGAGLEMIVAAAHGGRLQLLSFHPNLIAFTLVSFVVVQVWGWKAGGRLRWLSLLCAGVSTALLVLTNSRGSLAALIAAGLLCVALLAPRAIRGRRLLTRGRILLGCVLGLMLTASLPLIQDKVDCWYYSASDGLQLNNKGRGLHSGLSGRAGAWSETVYLLGDGSWIEGHGFRTSEDEMGTIDNGYLVLLYECGIVTALVVVFRYAQAVWRSGRIAFQASRASRTLLPVALCCLLCAFLGNNILDRYLFGCGNPFSLLGIFFVVSHKADYVF